MLVSVLIISFLNDFGLFGEHHFILAYTFSFGFYPCIVSLIVALYMRKCWWEFASIFGLITANLMGVSYFYFEAHNEFIDMYSTIILLAFVLIVTIGMVTDELLSINPEKQYLNG